MSPSPRLLLCILLSAGCAPTAEELTGPPPSALTLSPANVPARASAAVTKDLAIGDRAIAVDDASIFARGDLALLVQLAGATIDRTAGPTYGAVTDAGGAGTYELVRLAGVGQGALTLDVGLRRAFRAAGAVEIVRVPEIADALIPAGTTLTPDPWDGKHGGVIALSVTGVLQLDGAIDASARGFRGGALENLSRFPGSSTLVSTDARDGAEKGEGIAGDAAAYDRLGGRYGRGAPANGGGGGDAHNAGGGGGANVGATLDWDGLGVPAAGEPWGTDPELSAARPTRPSGGGRGGYTYSQVLRDPTAVPPGDTRWGGDGRRCVGGLGGRPLPFDVATPRLFLGGGGGAGDSNQQHGGRGGRGGGIVVVIAGRLQGAGVIRADGETGAPGVGFDGDAPGGGGGGGAVLLIAGADSGEVGVSVRGGAGGLQDQTVDPEAEGPGGGGGGGFVALRGAPRAADVAGGAGGLTNSTGVPGFPHNGATGGGAGRVELVDDGWAAAVPAPAGPDAGALDAAPGPSDATAPRDAPAPHDAATPQDPKPAADGGAPSDAAAPGDASAPADAAPSTDAAAPEAPSPTDAGADTTPRTDAKSPVPDASAPLPRADAATKIDAAAALTVTGGACAAAPGRPSGSWPLGLGLAVLLARARRRRGAKLARLGAALGALAVPALAQAQTAAPDAFSAEWLRVPTDRRAILDTPAEVGTAPGSITVGAWGGWASDPLVARTLPANSAYGGFVQDRVGGALGLAVGVAPGWAAELDVPVVLHQRRELQASPALGYASRGFGDLRVALRVTLFEARGWTVVLSPAATAPTGRSHSFIGEAGPTFAPDLVVAHAGSRLRTSLQGTWRVRREVRLADLRVDDDVALRAAAAVRLGTSDVEAQGSALLAFAVDQPFAQQNRTQAEAHLGLAGPLGPAASWVLGGGFGGFEGWGVPQRRLFAALRGTFEVIGSAPSDRDGDGLDDPDDRCPDAPEDRDGFQDDDGCPDPDDDGDGILDVVDRCPRAPETVNGLDDADGCPDWIPDRDGDGVSDAVDSCPAEPEDRDGFEDGDGCPDLDDDRDGVWDVDDACPRRPGPVERDGCPVPVAAAPESCGERLALLAPVYFRTDDATLDATARAVLREVLRLLAEHPAVRLRVEGHTDADGGFGYNDDLSWRRVDAVEVYLIAHGVASDRLAGQGRGKHLPAADNVTPVGKALNRRVTFQVDGGLATPVSR